MRILFVGDIVGRFGRETAAVLIPRLRKEYELDFCIANGENAAGGMGLTPKVAEELFTCGIDLITSGNHIWDKKEVKGIIDRDNRILRPYNYPPGVPGIGSTVVRTEEGINVGVLNLAGRVYLPSLDCPFRAADHALLELMQATSVIIVDFHAEVTSEKNAFGRYLDGRVSAVVGTHTHVQTADERILPLGTAYITDVGMTGSFDSIIGMKIEAVLQRFLLQIPTRFEAAEGDNHLCAVVITVDYNSGKATAIERVQKRL